MSTSERSIFEELERERARIARELHAGAGQPLAGIKLNLQVLEEALGTFSEYAVVLNRLRFLADSALAEIRAVSHKLQPPDWHLLSVKDAFTRLIHMSGLSQRFRTTVEVGELPEDLQQFTKIALYRCAQEGITNVLRHSDAADFRLSLSTLDTRLELIIADNGRGFDMQSGEPQSGIGLQSMREMIVGLGGTWNIVSGSEGTILTVRIPAIED